MEVSPKHQGKVLTKRLAAAFWLPIIVWAAVAAVYQGLSQRAAADAKFLRSDTKAVEAVGYDSANPEAHEIQGLLALQKEDFQLALGGFNRAIELRPNDYLLWVRRGYAHYKSNDFPAALEAYERASALAPHYSQPKLYTGYLYLKAGDKQRAFEYLSAAAAVDATLLPEVLHRARLAFPDDPVAVERAVRPDSIHAKKETARYFIKHKLMAAGTKAFLIGDELDARGKEEFVNRLTAADNYPLAFAVWKSKTDSARQISENNVLLNGDFETEIDASVRNFGWRVINDENIALAVDQTDFSSGAVSLKIQFSGNSDPDAAALSQLTLVEPAQKYRLTFFVRAQKLTTGGPPIISVTDAASRRVLGQSAPFSSAAGEWQKHTVDFTTAAQTTTVFVNLQRLKCPANPCPIFGTLWLDDLNLKKLNG